MRCKAVLLGKGFSLGGLGGRGVICFNIFLD